MDKQQACAQLLDAELMITDVSLNTKGLEVEDFADLSVLASRLGDIRREIGRGNK